MNIPHVYNAFKGIGRLRLLESGEITAATVKNCDILIVRYVTRVDKKLLAGSRIKFVGTVSAGTDHIDLRYLKDQEIAFSAAPGSNAESVAEYVIAALLSLHERGRISIPEATLGVVGIGNVGSRVAEKAKTLGINVLLNDPPKRRTTGDKSFRPLSKLMDSDVITIHTPLTFTGKDKTAGLFGAERLAGLKRGAVIINSARGGIVCERSLKECLESGRLGGAVIDVWENEPDIDPGLVELADISTPHVAGLSQEARLAAVCMIYAAVCAHFGIPSVWNPSILRRAPLPCVRSPGETLYSVLHGAVRRIYDIEKDSAEFKLEVVKVPTAGAAFTAFRKRYLRRFEFSSRALALSGPARFVRVMRSLGFNPR
ncbi:MAG: 4-phosphoerythronate dehydrogenase [Elusimicrobiota bacterium]|nr:4-phosphoerythronate dehydrogenase [Elusimicrobiota bacterium]